MTEDIAKVLKALSDGNRLNIVMSIGRETCSVSEIIKATGLSQTLVSFHLRALREANVVTTKRNGPFILYSLTDPNLEETLMKLAKSVSPVKMEGRGTSKPSLKVVGTKRRS